jgi:hypothetical protein
MIVGYRGNSSGYDLTSYWYMINEGSTALPYEPYYKPLVSYSFEGQCSQASIPSPTNPVEVECFGDLIASGDNAGKYDIPITSGGVTEHIILSEPLRKIGDYADSVNSEGVVTRRIKKLKISEIDVPWVDFTVDNVAAFRTNSEINKLHGDGIFTMLSNSYKVVNLRTGMTTNFTIAPYNNTNCSIICVRDDRYTTASEWLAENGDVELYYVLATPTTESVTAHTIPTSSGFSNIEIGTNLAPSKFTYDLGKMFMPQEEKVRVNGEWV